LELPRTWTPAELVEGLADALPTRSVRPELPRTPRPTAADEASERAYSCSHGLHMEGLSWARETGTCPLRPFAAKRIEASVWIFESTTPLSRHPPCYRLFPVR